MSNQYDLTSEEIQSTQDWLMEKWKKREGCIAAIIKLAKLRGERVTEETEKLLDQQSDEIIEKLFLTYL